MAEGNDQEDNLYYRLGQSQQNTPQSSASSLHRSAQDLHGIELETVDSPLDSGSSQPRQVSLPALTEPHRELLVTAITDAPDTPSARQSEAAESCLEASETPSSTSHIPLPVEPVHLRGTCTVARHSSAPARCGPYGREDGPTAGTGLSPTSETPEMVNTATEEATAATDADASGAAPADAPSMPKAAEGNDEANAAAASPSEEPRAEAAAAETANQSQELLAAAAATVSSKSGSLDKQASSIDAVSVGANNPSVTVNLATQHQQRRLGDNALDTQCTAPVESPISGQRQEAAPSVEDSSEDSALARASIKSRRRFKSDGPCIGKQDSSNLRKYRSELQEQDEPVLTSASEQEAPEPSQPLATPAAEPKPQLRRRQQDDEHRQEDEQQQQPLCAADADAENAPVPPQLSPETVEAPLTPAPEFAAQTDSQPVQLATTGTASCPSIEEDTGQGESIGVDVPSAPQRVSRLQRLVGRLSSLLQACSGRRSAGAAD